jgi:hypothetical protein
VLRKLDVLQSCCDVAQRDFATIEKTGLCGVSLRRQGGDGCKSPQQFVDWLATWAHAGIEHMVLDLQNLGDPAAFDLLATEVIPHLDSQPSGR